MMNNSFSPAILIPVYNHEHAIERVLKAVLKHQQAVLLVDDGSELACQKKLEHLHRHYAEQNVFLLRLNNNQGKGAAVKAGFRFLANHGFSHALQIDADGQHSITDIPKLLVLSQQWPKTLIAAYPEYDDSVPKIRYYGRYLTHIWVWINTLSFTIKDSMCGLRVYPLVMTIDLLNQEYCGDRMDFDTEIIVRWSWRGQAIKNIATEVHYPIDGVSHFNLFNDNWLITCMHTRLFLGMLKRLPQLLKRAIND